MAKKRRMKRSLITKAIALYLLRRKIIQKEKLKAAQRVKKGKPALAAIALPSMGRILYKAMGGGRLPVKAVVAASAGRAVHKKTKKVLRRRVVPALAAAALRKLNRPRS